MSCIELVQHPELLCYTGSSTDITITRSLQFDFKTIEAATNKFSESNIIGRGGFGEVFKVSFYHF